jgi:very-short-patch-repair endonuclease
LRALKPLGFHFRRQAPIGHYIADFVCHRSKIIIELDGSQHGEAANVLRDERRTAYLNSRGYRVLRFWNGEAMRGKEEVMSIVLRSLEAPPGRVPMHAPDLPARGR